MDTAKQPTPPAKPVQPNAWIDRVKNPLADIQRQANKLTAQEARLRQIGAMQ